MVIKIDRMELADLGNPTALASAVLQQLGAPAFPTPIEQIAYGCGITEIARLQPQGFEGALITNPAKSEGIILVNKLNMPQRRRFTVGHELGHYLNPWHLPPEGGFKCTAQDMITSEKQAERNRQRMEVEANEFAAEVLMPAALFRARLRATRAEPSTEAFCTVADEFEVSALASGRRMVDLRKDCALVLSQEGRILQLHRGGEFPFITRAIGDHVPPHSITKRIQGEPQEHSDTDEVDPEVWTQASVARGAKFSEQVYFQGSNFRLTLLVLDDSECEAVEEEDELIRSYAPRFRS